MRFFSTSILVVVALLTLTTVQAWSVEKADTPAKKTTETAQPAVSKIPGSYVSQAAAKTGVATCLARINQFASFIAADAQSGALLMPAPTDVDKKLFSVAMEVRSPSTSVVTYVSSSFSPAADGSCAGTYEAVNLWAEPCDTVAQKVFTKYKMADHPLSQQIKILVDGVSSHVFLVPEANGCLVIKKETIY